MLGSVDRAGCMTEQLFELRTVQCIAGQPMSRMGYVKASSRGSATGICAGAPCDYELGLVVITVPEGEITYQRPPLRFSACPVAVPGAVSPTYVYSGQPA